MKIVLLGTPIAKQRHRTFMRAGRSISYDPQHDIKKLVKTEILKQLRNLENEFNFASDDFFDVVATFYSPIPESFSQAQKNRCLWGLEEPTSNDVDNLCKFYLDCANKILFSDDRRVRILAAKKQYSLKPRTVLQIMVRKKTLSDEINIILSMIGPEQLGRLIEDIYDLVHLYDVTENDDWLEDYVASHNAREIRLTQTAYLLSRFSDKYANILKKISRACPGFWQRAENLAEEKTPMAGKPLC